MPIWKIRASRVHTRGTTCVCDGHRHAALGATLGAAEGTAWPVPAIPALYPSIPPPLSSLQRTSIPGPGPAPPRLLIWKLPPSRILSPDLHALAALLTDSSTWVDTFLPISDLLASDFQLLLPPGWRSASTSLPDGRPRHGLAEAVFAVISWALGEW